MQSLDQLSPPADFACFQILHVYNHMIVGFFIIIIFLNADSDSILSTTLMETRDQEGLNYLVVVKDSDQDQGSINSEELSSV